MSIPKPLFFYEEFRRFWGKLSGGDSLRVWISGILLALSILLFILPVSALFFPAYYLIEHNGYVAVYDVALERLCLYTQTPVNTLPVPDRQLICQGFACADETALAHALENFCS